MNRPASVPLVAPIFADLVRLEHLFSRGDPVGSGPSLVRETEVAAADWQTEAKAIVRDVQRRLDQVALLYATARRFSRQLTLRQVLDLTLDTLEQQAQYSFVVVLVGETELGPYYYQELRGVVDAHRFLGRQCPLPLWGELARALVRRLDPNEPDYLVIDDVAASGRPKPEEFPWLERNGSLLLLPLRNENVAIGALLLGRAERHGFDNPELCTQLLEIGAAVAAGLIHAETRQELQERADQLVGLQLYTKALTPPMTLPVLLQVIVHGASDLLEKAEICLLLRREVLGAGVEGWPAPQPIWLADEELYMAGNWLHREDDLPLVTALGRLARWVIDAGQGLFLNPEQDVESPADLYYNEVGRALLTPILQDNTALGVIYAVAPPGVPDFDESDMIVLRTLANVTAIALNLARLA